MLDFSCTNPVSILSVRFKPSVKAKLCREHVAGRTAGRAGTAAKLKQIAQDFHASHNFLLRVRGPCFGGLCSGWWGFWARWVPAYVSRAAPGAFGVLWG
jgi:hypothetical protein